ncbi:MAG: hypothetical protein M3020_01870 [Myxococcota bacterium]|nr:hypothetical protein [Myxococcota bacterium]
MIEAPKPSMPLDPADFELKLREITDNRVVIDIRGQTTRHQTETKGCQPTTRNLVAGFVHFENDKAALYLEVSPRPPSDALCAQLEQEGGHYTPK